MAIGLLCLMVLLLRELVQGLMIVGGGLLQIVLCALLGFRPRNSLNLWVEAISRATNLCKM